MAKPKGPHYPACPYSHHRASDWRLKGHTLIVCGVCHPPAVPDDHVVRRPQKATK